MQEYIASELSKPYEATTWTAFGVRHGQVRLSNGKGASEAVLAFPLPGGGHHIYRYEQSNRRQRWRFADGGKADLLTAGLDRDDPVILAEGEWDAMRAYELGFVILDYAMPGLDGGSVARAMRRELSDAPPALLLTAGRHQQSQAERMGIPGLCKPFRVEELLATVAMHRPASD